jgi:ubiquinone/menaquinone biosynthesis C-methylase UbiE
VTGTDSFTVGRRLSAVSSALRPPALDELRAYGGIQMLRGKRVLDVGTGDGRLALGAAPYAHEVHGVDPDAGALRSARAKAREHGLENVHFRIGAAQELPYPDPAFDVVILSWTL